MCWKSTITTAGRPRSTEQKVTWSGRQRRRTSNPKENTQRQSGWIEARDKRMPSGTTQCSSDRELEERERKKRKSIFPSPTEHELEFALKTKACQRRHERRERWTDLSRNVALKIELSCIGNQRAQKTKSCHTIPQMLITTACSFLRKRMQDPRKLWQMLNSTKSAPSNTHKHL